MEIVKHKNIIIRHIDALKLQGKTIGLVPTMGALHNGHLSLIEKASTKTDIVIVSIFVNPNQFNNPVDFNMYPRDLQKDIDLLETTPCSLVFAPSVEEIYPEPDTRVFDFGHLDKVMEGKHRPGHFNGVAQVVSVLFDIIKPHKAFFGEKDFQQLAIIRNLVNQCNYDIEIIACQTVREYNGLAMSSRNMLLSEKLRKKVPIISQTLLKSCNFAKSNDISRTKLFVCETINSVDELKVEYFEIVDGNSLQVIDNWNVSDYIVGCIAVYAGQIRLIDNVIYKKIIS
jgi:pantoate--beta-alanine ligase